jgi:hypothetical protein
MTIGSRLIGQTLDALHLISLYTVNPFFFLGFFFDETRPADNFITRKRKKRPLKRAGRQLARQTDAS